MNAFIARTRDTAERERQMVSAASHEIRTPLAVVITQLELAHRHFGDADALEKEIRAAEGSSPACPAWRRTSSSSPAWTPHRPSLRSRLRASWRPS